MKQIRGVEFDTEVLAAKQPVLVDFYSQDCGPCRAMAPVLQEWESEANGAMKIVKVDIGEEQMLASSFRVNAVPAFFAFANGKCVGQTLGLKSKANIKKWFDEAVKSAA